MFYFNNIYSFNISKKPILFSVEGNIGSGKSTLVKILQDRFADENIKICFLQEPVDEWSQFCDANGETILEKYYKDQESYSFQFQMMAYISRLKSLRDVLDKNYDVIITERSVLTDRNVFAKMLFDSEKLSKIEYSIYTKWFDEFLKDIPKQNIIYLKTKPKIAHQRVINRARNGEDIPLDYLEKCHEYHQKWLHRGVAGQMKPFQIDGNVNFFENTISLDDCIVNISKYIIKIMCNSDKNLQNVLSASN